MGEVKWMERERKKLAKYGGSEMNGERERGRTWQSMGEVKWRERERERGRTWQSMGGVKWRERERKKLAKYGGSEMEREREEELGKVWGK